LNLTYTNLCIIFTKGGEQTMKEQDRMVYKVPGKGWANKRNSAERPEAYYQTQKSAEDAARQNLINAGGGELSIKGENGKIRDKNTIGKGNDPCPPKDKP
jgi:hypothetical protein